MALTHGRTGHVARLASAQVVSSPSPGATRPAALTAREGEIARMIARGLSNRQIAAALAVSGRTVEWHVGNVLEKLGLQSRVQIAVWALGDNEEGVPGDAHDADHTRPSPRRRASSPARARAGATRGRSRRQVQPAEPGEVPLQASVPLPIVRDDCLAAGQQGGCTEESVGQGGDG